MSSVEECTVKNIDGKDYLELPVVCDLTAAAKVHATVTDRLGEEDLNIDAGAVERCGTAAAQVLLATSAELSQQGNRLKLTAMSDQFKQAFADLGLEDCLGEWE